jgi:hypothetical protein
MSTRSANGALLLALALLACSSSSSRQAPAPLPEGGKGVCTPGMTEACLGPERCAGVQICDDQGARFGPCSCGAGPDASAGGSGGASGSGGSSGARGGATGGSGGNGNAGAGGSGGTGAQSSADARSDAPVTGCMGATSGTDCVDMNNQAGTCLGGSCCTGCVAGGTCHLGTIFTLCGRRGAPCQVCNDSPVCNQPTDPDCSGKAGFHPYGCYANTCTHLLVCCNGNTCSASGCGP